MSRNCTPPPAGILAPPSLGELQNLEKARVLDQRVGKNIVRFLLTCEFYPQDLPDGVFPQRQAP
jgi:hypothetical protein